MKKILMAVVVAAVVALSAHASAQGCATCYVASNIDAAYTSHVEGWGFECNSGATLSHFDAYYYDASGGLHRLADAYIINGLERMDVYSYFLNGGGCPSVPINSGLHIYFPTPPPTGSTVAIVLWYGSIYSTQYVTVN